ncbi:MAG: hypothetical protein IKG56_03835 [Clostridia bacterium]|nr:hypothetical protein [Clostridia bacterium]
MKNKIIYILLAVIFAVAIVMTFVKGLNVDLYYGEGYTISVTEKDSINIDDIKQIVEEIWGKEYIVQRLEFFDDSAEIKVKEYDDDKLTQLKDKLNEKYESELEVSDFKVEHISNIKLRTLVEPYIIPIGLSLLLVMAFYAIRYRGARKMLDLLVGVVAVEGLFYSLYAIGRIPFNSMTLPIAICLYIITIIKTSFSSENSQEEE